MKKSINRKTHKDASNRISRQVFVQVCGQTNQNIRFWIRESVIAGPCKAMGVSCPKKPQTPPKGFSSKAFLKCEGSGSQGLWLACATGSVISLCTVLWLANGDGIGLSQRLTLSVLKLQEAWGYVLIVIKYLNLPFGGGRGGVIAVEQLRKCVSNTIIYSTCTSGRS